MKAAAAATGRWDDNGCLSATVGKSLRANPHEMNGAAWNGEVESDAMAQQPGRYSLDTRVPFPPLQPWVILKKRQSLSSFKGIYPSNYGQIG